MTRKVVLGLVVALAGCGAGGSVGDPVGTSVSKLIGAGGGMVSTPAGAAIVVPAGALPGDTMISITATAAVPPSLYGQALGVNYQFGPPGTLFLKPVTMNLPFGNLPSGVDPTRDLQVLTAPDGSMQYTSLGPAKLIDAGHAGATTLHFSQCVITTQPGGGSGNGTGGGGTGGGGGGIPGQCNPSCLAGSGGPTAPAADLGAPTGGGSGGSGSGGGSGGTPPADGGTSTGGGGTGGSTTCGCQDACNGNANQLVCDGTNCTCIQNGVIVGMAAQGPECVNPLGAWSTLCKFPIGSPVMPGGDGGSGGTDPPDGGAPFLDAGIGPVLDGGGTSTCPPSPSCSGSSQGCDCMETCGGMSYALHCVGTACTCNSSGGSPSSFTASGTPCDVAVDFHGTCKFP